MNRRSLQRRILAAVLIGLAVGAGGLADAAWTDSGSGTGYSKATTASALVIGDASGSTTADLYPGGTGTLYVLVSNPNPFAVTVANVVSAGTITSNKGAACDASTGVTFANQAGLSQVIVAGSSATLTLSGAVSMTNASDTTCQGAIFSIPVTVSGTS
jgi:hypothetical protein